MGFPFLSAGGQETKDTSIARDIAQFWTGEESYLTPYLGLRARLSQVWINRWTILILLVLIRTLIACADLDSDIGNAKIQALSACSGVESTGSAMASMPHYLAKGVNELASAGVEHAVSALMDMLELTVTGIEAIVVFIIDLMTSTYLCLITLAISGSLHASISLIEDVTGFLNTTLGNIGNDIDQAVVSFQNDLNSLTSEINKLLSPFESAPAIPTLNIASELSQLKDLQLPSSLDADLQKLNASIPTFSQVQNFTNNVIRIPFEDVKSLISQSPGNYTMDSSIFPVPAKQTLTFCSDNNGINDFFNSLVTVTSIARKIFIAVLLVAAVLVCGPMVYREIRGWRTMVERAKMVNIHAYDPLDVIYIASRPYTASAGLFAAKPFKTNRRKILTRWVVAYATTTPALYVLSLGVAGLMASLCQYMLLRAIQKEVPALSHQVQAFSEEVVNSLTAQSKQWANETNGMIYTTNQRVNNDVFGWVNTTTHGLNMTLNAFVDEMTGALNATFGGTILYEPILGVFNCLVGLKIAGIEKGLTWVSDNAYVNFPMFPDDIYSSGASASIQSSAPNATFLATQQSDTGDAITNAVISLTQKLESTARNEAMISACVVGIWVLVFLIGLIRAIFLFFGSRECRGDSGTRIIPTDPSDPFSDSYQMRAYGENSSMHIIEEKQPESRAPSYEGVVRADSLNNAGNQYKGIAYTLDPRPFPLAHATSTPDDRPVLAQIDEKVGYAGARPVAPATQRPSDWRHSSRADMKMTTPGVGPARHGTFERMGY